MRKNLIFKRLKVLSLFPTIFCTTVSYGQYSQRDVRFAPEYDDSRSIVYSFGDVPLRPFYFPDGYGRDLVKERMAMYKKVVQGLPNIEHIFLVDSQLEFNGRRARDIVEQDFFAPLRESGKFNIKIVDQTFNDDSWPDEWTRDFVSLSLANAGGLIGFWGRSGRGQQVNKILSSHYGIPLVLGDSESPMFFENGNFMADSEGRCYFSEVARKSTSPFEPYCTEIVYLPNLDLEGTKHVDLYSKVIEPRKVVVTRYLDDSVGIRKGYNKVQYKCSDEQIREKKWLECDHTGVSHSTETFELETLSDGRPLLIKFHDIIGEIKKRYPNLTENMDFDGPAGLQPISKFPRAVNWANHFDEVSRHFTNRGFEVIPIVNQVPILAVSITEYQNEQGQIVRHELSVRLVFRSYANSLVTNKKGFVPIYPYSGVSRWDEDAIAQYKTVIPVIFPIESDYAALGGGDSSLFNSSNSKINKHVEDLKSVNSESIFFTKRFFF